MSDETNSSAGSDPTAGGSSDHGDSSDQSAAGHDASGNRSGSHGGNGNPKSPERVKWAGIAAAFVTVVVLISQLYGQVTGNTEKSNKIIEKVQQLPAVVDKVGDINDSVKTLKDQIEDQPTPMSTTIIKKGQPGQPGKPGQVVTSPPQTRVITTPGPTTTIRPSAAPTCNTKLIGTCIVP